MEKLEERISDLMSSKAPKVVKEPVAAPVAPVLAKPAPTPKPKPKPKPKRPANVTVKGKTILTPRIKDEV